MVSLKWKHLGPYRLLDVIGTGVMGTVYRADRTDGQFQKRVAIKVVPAAIHSRNYSAASAASSKSSARWSIPTSPAC